MVLKSIFTLFIILLFTSCGSSGSSSEPSEPSPKNIQKSVSGYVVDGYLKQATICIDTNNNELCDINETKTISNNEGFYSFENNVSGDYNVLVVGGIDTATNKNFQGFLKHHLSFENNTSAYIKNITPLSTVISVVKDSNPQLTIQEISQNLASNLNISQDKLLIDPMKDKDVFLYSQLIMQTSHLIYEELNDTKEIRYDVVFKSLANNIVKNSDANISIDTIDEYNITVSSEIQNKIATLHSYIKTRINENNITDLDTLQNNIETQKTIIQENNISDEDNITQTNTKPIALFNAFTLNEDSIYYGVLNGSDEDNNTLSFSLIVQPSNGTISLESNGSFSYTPNSNYAGNDSFSYKVYDGSDYSTIQEVSISINQLNDIPSATFSSFNTNEDTSYSNILTGFDVDEDTLTFNLVSNPSHGILNIDSNGSFSYTPTTNFYGQDSFSYKVYDGRIYSDIQTVDITISSVNDLPHADAGGNIQEMEGREIFFSAIASFDYDNNLTYIWEINNTTISTDINFSKNDFAIGEYNITLTVHEIGGEEQDSDSITVIVDSIPNTKPSATFTSFNTNEDTPYSNILTGSDVDGDTLTFNLVSNPSHGVLNIDSNGSFSYTPNSNFYGQDSFSYKVYDGRIYSDIQTVDITISSVNDLPTPSFSNFTTDEDISYQGILSANDIENDPLTFQLESNVLNGTLSLESNGSFSYTPNSNYAGHDSFSYKVYDGSDYSTIQEVSISVLLINSKPVATSDNFEVIEINSNPSYNTFNGQLSASDEDNDTLTYLLEQNTSNGSIEIDSNGTFHYTNFRVEDGNQSETFQYKVYDGNVYSDIKTVTLNLIDINMVLIVKINGVQIAYNQTIEIPETTNITFDASQSYQYNKTIVAYKWEDQGKADLSSSSNFSINSLTFGEHSIIFTMTNSDEGLGNSSTFRFTLSITSNSNETPENILLPSTNGISFPPQIP